VKNENAPQAFSIGTLGHRPPQKMSPERAAQEFGYTRCVAPSGL